MRFVKEQVLLSCFVFYFLEALEERQEVRRYFFILSQMTKKNVVNVIEKTKAIIEVVLV